MADGVTWSADMLRRVRARRVTAAREAASAAGFCRAAREAAGAELDAAMVLGVAAMTPLAAEYVSAARAAEERA